MRTVLLTVAVAVALALALLSVSPAGATPGDPDPTFGAGGVTVTPVGYAGAYAAALAIQPDGAIVVGGESYDGRGGFPLTLVRFTPTGAVDPAFGAGGVATAPGAGLAALATAPGGGLVAAGYRATGAGRREPLVARFTPSGHLDPSFGAGGLAGGPVGDGDAAARAVAVAGNGDVIVASDASRAGERAIAITRYAGGGASSTSFVALPGRSVTAAGIALTADGSVVVAGTASDPSGAGGDALVMRLKPDGTIYSTVVPSPLGSIQASALALTPDGTAILACSLRAPLRSTLAAISVRPDGSLDASFGAGGVAAVPAGSSDSFATAVALDASGGVLLAGAAIDGSGGAHPALLRLTPDGALDPAFHPPDELTGYPGSNARPAALKLDLRGRLVMAGSAFSAGREQLTVARWWASMR